jgi:DNA-binding beta-propeller fold protein YncE
MNVRVASAARSRWLELACALLPLVVAACGPAQQVTASPPQASPLEFVGEWGMKGEGPGELADPAGIAVDLNNRVYLADRRTGLLQKFESSGVPSLAYSDASVRSTSALTVDSGDAIYVADARGGRVWIHFPEGDPLRNFRVIPQRAADAFSGFCVTADGRIIVPDPDGGRIQAFAAAGRLESTWKLPPSPAGKSARPVAVAAGLDEFVYIADSASGRIAKFTNRGAQVALWDAPADAVSAPLRGIGVSRSHLFALRGVEPQLEVWTFDGVRVLTDTLGGRLNAAPPAAVYFAVSRDEQIFVLDAGRQRVLRFRLNLQPR